MIEFNKTNVLIFGTAAAVCLFIYFQLNNTNQAVQSLVKRIDAAVQSKKNRIQAAQNVRAAPPRPQPAPGAKPLKEFDQIRANNRMTQQRAHTRAPQPQLQERLQPRGATMDTDMRGPQSNEIANMRSELNMQIA